MRSLLLWLERHWLLLLVIVLFIVFVATNLDAFMEILRALVLGQWQWILAAILAQGAYYLLYAVQYQYAFATVGVASRIIELLPVLFVSAFVKTIVPSAGISGAALFVDDAVRRGQSGARAAEGSLLVLILDLATLLPLLLYTLIFLGLENVLIAYQIFGAVVFTLFIAALVVALFLGRWNPQLLRRLFQVLQQAANWAAHQIGRPDVLPESESTRIANDFIRAANNIATHRQDLQRTTIAAMVDQLINLISLEAVGRAYFQPLGIGTTVAAFTMEALFSVVSITPNGIVVAEAVMAQVLISLGIPLGNAILITLVYRGISVWLPVLVGFLLLRFERTFRGGGGRGW